MYERDTYEIAGGCDGFLWIKERNLYPHDPKNNDDNLTRKLTNNG